MRGVLVLLTTAAAAVVTLADSEASGTKAAQPASDAHGRSIGNNYGHLGGYPGTGYPGTGYPGTGYPGTGYPGTGYPGTGYPGTGYPGTGNPYVRPSSCKHWCKRDNYYPGSGRQQYYCCNTSGPNVYRPEPLVIRPPYGGGYSGNGGYHSNNGYNGNNGYHGNGGYNGNYHGNSGGYPGVSRQKVCPPGRPVCLRSYAAGSPPTECYTDSECSITDSCCYDTCLNHKVCKTSDYVDGVAIGVPYNGGLRNEKRGRGRGRGRGRHGGGGGLLGGVLSLFTRGGAVHDEPVAARDDAGAKHGDSGSVRFAETKKSGDTV